MRYLRILLGSYVSARLKPHPVWAHLYVTRRCNLHCSYCGVRDPQKKDLPTHKVKKTVDKMYQLGVRFISFFGGEPTLRKDFPEIVEYAHAKGMITHVSTNGMLLDDMYIERIAKAGVDIINVSIDSIAAFDGSEKSYQQGKALLERLIAARSMYSFEIQSNLVLTARNLKSVVPVIKELTSSGIALSLAIIDKIQDMRSQVDSALFFRTESQKQELYRIIRYVILLKRSGVRLLDPLQYYYDLITHLNGGVEWYCCAGEYSVSVDVDNRIQLCAGMPSEDIDIMRLDSKSYRAKVMPLFRQRMRSCKPTCFSCCLYDTSYCIKHPLYVIKTILLPPQKSKFLSFGKSWRIH